MYMPNTPFEVKINNSEFVVIRIWLAKINGVEAPLLDVLNELRLNPEANACVGHISLQIIKNNGSESRYASYWPKQPVSIEQTIDGELYDLREDIRIKGMPDHTYYLFSLNCSQLWSSMEKSRLKEEYPLYTLIDGAALRNKVQKKVSTGNWLWGGSQSPKATEAPKHTNKAVSCSGLVYDLLMRHNNNLKHLKISMDIARDYIVSSPNIMVDMMREAERNERNLFPQSCPIKDNLHKYLSFHLLSLKSLEQFKLHIQHLDDLLKSSEHYKKVIQHESSLSANLSLQTNTSITFFNPPLVAKSQVTFPEHGLNTSIKLLTNIGHYPKSAISTGLIAAFFIGQLTKNFTTNDAMKTVFYLSILIASVALLIRYCKNEQTASMHHNQDQHIRISPQN